MTLILPLSIFLAIGHRWTNGHKEAYDHYQWEGFAVVLSTGILGTIVAAWKSDPVWSLGSVWVLWCIGAARPKAAPVAVCGVCLTLVPSYTKNTCRALSSPLRSLSRSRLWPSLCGGPFGAEIVDTKPKEKDRYDLEGKTKHCTGNERKTKTRQPLPHQETTRSGLVRYGLDTTVK